MGVWKKEKKSLLRDKLPGVVDNMKELSNIRTDDKLNNISLKNIILAGSVIVINNEDFVIIKCTKNWMKYRNRKVLCHQA